MGETEAPPAWAGSRESSGDRSSCPRLVGLLGTTLPGVSACGGEGLDRAPLAVLLGVGAQGLRLAGKVLDGWGLPQLGAPLELGRSLTSTCPEGRPLASTLGTSPELMEPETRNHRIQLPTLMGASPGSMNSAQRDPSPKITHEFVPQCLVGGASLRQCLPLAVGKAG